MKYKPYMMKDVIAGEKQNKFKVISTFAGGGGSSTGYRLAGGKILAINEFVEEARNTYRDEQLDIIDAGEKVKKLIQQHLYALRNDVLKVITSGKVPETIE